MDKNKVFLVSLNVVPVFGLDLHSACTKTQRAAKAISDSLVSERR